MSEAVIVAVITGILAIIGDIIISARNSRELYSKLDKQSELSDERIHGEISVIQTEITELRKNVEKHNQVVERVYGLEQTVARHDEKIKTLFAKAE